MKSSQPAPRPKYFRLCTPKTELVVEFYSVERGYGFLSDGVSRFYFRAEDFLLESQDDPPPITGEPVEVEDTKEGKARGIRRKSQPVVRHGVVESFDPQKGWGFIREFESNGKRLFLHRSEMQQNWMPIKGTAVEYYEGQSRERPRACHIKKC